MESGQQMILNLSTLRGFVLWKRNGTFKKLELSVIAVYKLILKKSKWNMYEEIHNVRKTQLFMSDRNHFIHYVFPLVKYKIMKEYLE